MNILNYNATDKQKNVVCSNAAIAISTSKGNSLTDAINLARESIDSKNALLGKSFISGLLPDLKDATINLIIRDNEKILPPFDDIILQTNDRLIIAITKNELIQKIKSRYH